MFEFHGWFSIIETPFEYDNGGLQDIVATLQEYLAQMEWPSGFFDLRPLNGAYYLCIHASPNRPREYHQDLDGLLNLIAEKATGSYGLLYWRDDEDDSPPGRANFHVKVLAKGTIAERFDPFLSPAIPVIEDEEKV